jgi:hypothetical protein
VVFSALSEVLLFFDGGYFLRPIIAGVLAPRDRPILRSVETVETTVAADLPDFACVDGKRVVIRGRDEIVFSCGEASIRCGGTARSSYEARRWNRILSELNGSRARS